MNNNFIFVLVIILILFFLNTFRFENYQTQTNEYNVILINHEKYQIIVVKNINNGHDKIYKIYKN